MSYLRNCCLCNTGPVIGDLRGRNVCNFNHRTVTSFDCIRRFYHWAPVSCAVVWEPVSCREFMFAVRFYTLSAFFEAKLFSSAHLSYQTFTLRLLCRFIGHYGDQLYSLHYYWRARRLRCCKNSLFWKAFDHWDWKESRCCRIIILSPLCAVIETLFLCIYFRYYTNVLRRCMFRMINCSSL